MTMLFRHASQLENFLFLPVNFLLMKGSFVSNEKCLAHVFTTSPD